MIAKNELNEFLKHSNFIENERSEQALQDAHRAWRFAFKHRKEINLQKILKIHWLLLRNINPEIAGRFRDRNVWIGGKQKYFISEALLREEVVDWLEINNRLKSGDPKEAHIYFEHLHPFIDGNGRVGRILYNIHRINLGQKIHIIHEGNEQRQYYSWFS